jgi:hypothetical protein
VPKLQVFDPPMCCSTGVCGPSVDPALAQFASALEELKAAGVEVERFNLGQEPAAFVGNPVVSAALRGGDVLPFVLFDGGLVAKGTYPTREELRRLAGVAPGPKLAVATACCPPRADGSASKRCC